MLLCCLSASRRLASSSFKVLLLCCRRRLHPLRLEKDSHEARTSALGKSLPTSTNEVYIDFPIHGETSPLRRQSLEGLDIFDRVSARATVVVGFEYCLLPLKELGSA